MVLTHCDLSLQDSDGEKSDDNLVVDVSNEVYAIVVVVPYSGGGGWCLQWFLCILGMQRRSQPLLS